MFFVTFLAFPLARAIETGPTIIWRVVLHGDDSVLVSFEFGRSTLEIVCLAPRLFSFVHFCRIFLQMFCRNKRIACTGVIFPLSLRVCLFLWRVYNIVVSLRAVPDNHTLVKWIDFFERLATQTSKSYPRKLSVVPNAIIDRCFSTTARQDSINNRLA